MKLKKLSLSAALMIAGCASTQEVLKMEPVQVVHSERTADDVAFCLSNKNNVPAVTKGDGSRVVLIKNGYGAVGMAFSVFPEGSGSRIEFRKAIGIGIAAWKQCAGLKPEK